MTCGSFVNHTYATTHAQTRLSQKKQKFGRLVKFFLPATFIYSFNKMKKQKSSIIVLSCSESSGDESEKAKPKIDKGELRKYLQNSDEEDESDKETSPKKTKKVIKKRKTSSHNDVDQDKPTKSFEKPKKLIQKDSPQKYLLKGDDFKRLHKILLFFF